MQLLFFVDRLLTPLGGAEAQARLLIRYLVGRGHQVSVITREPEADASNLLLEGVCCIGCGNADGLETSPTFFLRAVKAAMRQRDRCDLMIAFQLTSSALAAVAVGRMAGRPVVIRLSGGGEAGDIHTSRRSWLGRMKLSLVKRFAQRYIGISQDLVQEMVCAGFPPDRITEVPNGVDVELFRPASFDQKNAIRTELDLPAGLLAVYAGRFASEKGLLVLLEAWKQLVGRGQVSATLVLVGRGPLDLVPHETEDDAAFSETVIIREGDKGTAAYLQAADLFLLPSFCEGMSNALLEAMSTGLPVVGTAVGGTPQLVRDDEQGALVPPNDATALLEAMERLLGDGELREQLGRSARRRVEQNFAIHRIGRYYERLFDELLVGSHPPPPSHS